MKTKKVNKEIPETFQNEVVMRRSNISIVAIIGIIVGLALICGSAFYVQDSASTLYMFAMTAGVILVVYYIIVVSLRKSDYYYKDTNSKIEGYTLYYNPIERDSVLKTIQKGLAIKGLEGSEESSLKVDYIISVDGKFAACQMCHYIPYNYVPDSEVFRIDGEKLKAII